MLEIFIAVSFIEFSLWIMDSLSLYIGQERIFTGFDAQCRLQGNFNFLSSKFERYQRQATARDKISSFIDLESQSNFSLDPSIISPCFGVPPWFCIFSRMPDILTLWIRLFNNISHSQFFFATQTETTFFLSSERARVCPGYIILLKI